MAWLTRARYMWSAPGLETGRFLKLFGQYVEEESLFGFSVAYPFEHAIIGSLGAEANLGIDSGAVDIIENNGGVWFRYPEGRPVPDHYNDNVGFGAGVDIPENELIISATI